VLQRIRSTIKRLPFVGKFLKTDRWAKIRHKLLLRSTERTNSNCTAFLRCSMQLDVLLGPVLDMLLSDNKEKKIKFIVAGCSIGSESFTIASILKARRPDLMFDIHSFDIAENTIDMAREGIYERRHVFNHRNMTDEFVSYTFDKIGDKFKIKDEIASHVVFEIGNALDSALVERFGQADILFAQNFLYHLPPKESGEALENLCTLLKPKSALFIDGVDLDIRERVTSAQGLIPLDFKIEEIHNELRSVSVNSSGDYSETSGSGWPYQYWGLEPLSKETKDWKRRYATVFVRDKK